MAKDIVLLIGESGIGKSYLRGQMMQIFNNLEGMPTVTNRDAKPGDGNTRIFFSDEKFQQYINADMFAEFAEVHPGQFYGTLWRDFENIPAGIVKIKDIDIEGAKRIQEKSQENNYFKYVSHSIDFIFNCFFNTLN